MITDTLNRTILEQMQTALICTTPDLSVVYANAASEALLYINHVRIQGSNIGQLFEECDQLHQLTTRAINNNQAFSLRDVSARPRHLDGHHALVDLTVTPFQISDQANCDENTYLLFEVTTKDRQAKIAHEEQQNQQHAVTRQMIRGVAHEVKNPLAGIRGAAQLLQRTLKKMAEMTEHQLSTNIATQTTYHKDMHEFADVIIQESDRLKMLADNMLGSNQLPNITITNIHEPLEHVQLLIKTQFSSLKFVRDYDVSIPDIAIDRNKFVQVILNIAQNAAQALTENSGDENPIADPKLTFKTRIVHNVVLKGKNHRQLLGVSIIDNGKGIPPALQKTLFYPMVTGRAQGTGLGLSIAQDIVQQHGGKITCKSHAGHTVFHVYLPLKTHLTQ